MVESVSYCYTSGTHFFLSEDTLYIHTAETNGNNKIYQLISSRLPDRKKKEISMFIQMLLKFHVLRVL